MNTDVNSLLFSIFSVMIFNMNNKFFSVYGGNFASNRSIGIVSFSSNNLDFIILSDGNSSYSIFCSKIFREGSTEDDSSFNRSSSKVSLSTFSS